MKLLMGISAGTKVDSHSIVLHAHLGIAMRLEKNAGGKIYRLTLVDRY